MHAFVVFAPRFVHWPLAIVDELARRDPALRVSALATGEAAVAAQVAARAPSIAPLHHLAALEATWLARPSDPARLASLAARCDPDIVSRLIVSDRHVGAALVTGATLPTSPLRRLCRSADPVRRYVTGLLEWAFSVVDQESPDVVFSYVVAGSPALALAEACRVTGVPFRRIASTRIGTRRVLDDSPRGLLAPVRRLFSRSLRDDVAIASFRPGARRWLADFRSRPRPPDYSVGRRRAFEQRTSALAIAKQAAGSLVHAARERFRRAPSHLREVPTSEQIASDLRESLRARRLGRAGPFTSWRDPPERFAFYPLHVDPEASTMVLAPWRTDQLAVIELLRRSIPEELELVVKEHLPMLGRRPRGFYDRIRRLPRTRLISPFADGFDMIRRAELVAVITGTAAWEALLLGRPALVVGASPFAAIGEGLVVAGPDAEVADRTREALSMPPASDERLELWIAASLAASFDFPSEAFWGRVEARTIESHAPALAAFCDGLIAAAASADRVTEIERPAPPA